MIKNIKLKCFRKHLELNLDLSQGLQTIRGANEGGKTTILEGASYALFGAKALRNSLADTVTWDHKDSELKAEVVLQVNDRSYTFVRSKAGAEVILGGSVFVTGQNEVSNFAASLLGADVNVAHHLMLSGQGGLRGVLDQGPKATSSLIETLSDLDLIDRLIEAGQEKLQLGSTAVLADRLKAAEEKLATLVPVAEPAKPDLETMAADLKKIEEQVAAQKPVVAAALAAYEAEVAKREKLAQLERSQSLVLDQVQDAARDLELEKGKLLDVVPNVDGAAKALEDAKDWDKQRKAWEKFAALPWRSVDGTEYPADEFATKLQRQRQLVADIEKTITSRKLAIARIEPQISDTHQCSACGQDTSHLEAVQKKQQGLRQDLEDSKRELNDALFALPEAERVLADLVDVETADTNLRRAAAKVGGYIEMDETVVPVKVDWTGPAIDCEHGPDLEALEQVWLEAKNTRDEQLKVKARIESIRENLAKLATRNTQFSKEIAELGLADDDTFAELARALDEANSQQTILNGYLAMGQISLEEAQRQYSEARQAYDNFVTTKTSQESAVETLRQDIETTNFNNALIKKVRSARPIIANKLWNLVLTTVSTLFSQMRGETSIVAKAKDGFTVNGKPVESLSGSTLDLLGLAIRCALIKTFVPNCPFLILDEPSAACDDSRSAALVGFVAAAGFEQIILVTHEDVSESLSSNLIQI